MHQDGIWYGGRPRPAPPPLPPKGAQQLPLFCPCLPKNFQGHFPMRSENVRPTRAKMIRASLYFTAQFTLYCGLAQIGKHTWPWPRPHCVRLESSFPNRKRHSHPILSKFMDAGKEACVCINHDRCLFLLYSCMGGSRFKMPLIMNVGLGQSETVC